MTRSIRKSAWQTTGILCLALALFSGWDNYGQFRPNRDSFKVEPLTLPVYDTSAWPEVEKNPRLMDFEDRGLEWENSHKVNNSYQQMRRNPFGFLDLPDLNPDWLRAVKGALAWHGF